MRGRGVATTAEPLFPLAVSGRRLVSPSGRPFLLVGDTPWSIAVQLTHAQIDRYLDHRRGAGFNAILFNAIEHYFSSQSPAYRNASGFDPFTTMTDFASPNENYWRTVDYIVNGCLTRGIVAMINPAYLGYNGGTEGWMSEITAESAGDLQTYGAWLARRYPQQNVVWCLGGDYAGTVTEREKQWNIVTGMRTVRTDQVITGHPVRADETAQPKWNGYAGFNLNSVYIPTTNIADARCATAYSQGMAYFMLEGGYEGEYSQVAADIRRASFTSLLSGACGTFMGNNPLWGFGEPNFCGGVGVTASLNSSLNSAAAQEVRHLRALFDGYDWPRLVPKTDASLVSSSLGTSGTTGRVCPALDSEGRFAMIWTPSVNLTVVMSNFRQSSVRGRWYDPSNGTWSDASGTPFANTGSQSFTAPGERVLVLD